MATVCGQCSSSNKDNDRFCKQCGGQLYMSRDQVLLSANGVDGQLELFSDRIRIARSGFWAKYNHGLNNGDNDIQISRISSIEFQSARVLLNGHIKFFVPGGRQVSWRKLQNPMNTSGMFSGDKLTIVFKRDQQQAFYDIKTRIEEILSKMEQNAVISTPTATSSGSIADEIEKLASLRDKGIISHEEFDAKKRQLLGL